MYNKNGLTKNGKYPHISLGKIFAMKYIQIK
jgi:hypothetical protein